MDFGVNAWLAVALVFAIASLVLLIAAPKSAGKVNPPPALLPLPLGCGGAIDCVAVFPASVPEVGF